MFPSRIHRFWFLFTSFPNSKNSTIKVWKLKIESKFCCILFSPSFLQNGIGFVSIYILLFIIIIYTEYLSRNSNNQDHHVDKTTSRFLCVAGFIPFLFFIVCLALYFIAGKEMHTVLITAQFLSILVAIMFFGILMPLFIIYRTPNMKTKFENIHIFHPFVNSVHAFLE